MVRQGRQPTSSAPFAPQLQACSDSSRQSGGAADADGLLGQILDKSEGVFLYVERFCDDVQQNHLPLDRSEQFPQGLGGIFCQWFQRQFPDLEKFRKDVRPALRANLAAREPQSVEILRRIETMIANCQSIGNICGSRSL